MSFHERLVMSPQRMNVSKEISKRAKESFSGAKTNL